MHGANSDESVNTFDFDQTLRSVPLYRELKQRPLTCGFRKSKATRLATVVILTVLASNCSKSDSSEGRAEPTTWDSIAYANRIEGRTGRAPVITPVPEPESASRSLEESFLRSMVDHHRSVLVIAHAALDANGAGVGTGVLRRIEERHDHGLDTLRRTFRTLFTADYPGKESSIADSIAARIRAKPVLNHDQLIISELIRAEKRALSTANAFLDVSKSPRFKPFLTSIRRDLKNDFEYIRLRQVFP